MQYFDQIVVGHGTSALSFLSSALRGSQKARFVGNTTAVIGRNADQLWSRIHGGNTEHRMGQPAALLTAPSKSNANQTDSQAFLKVGDYNRMLKSVQADIETGRSALAKPKPAQLLGGTENHILDYDRPIEPIVFLNESVRSVDVLGGGYKVTTDAGKDYAAKQVVIACGAGPGQMLEDLPGKIVLEGMEAAKRSGRYIEANDYLAVKHSDKIKSVMVYGGSATSSWCVDHAHRLNGVNVMLWMCRSGIASIRTDGNPIDRNKEIIAEAEEAGIIRAGEIKSVSDGPDGLTITFVDRTDGPEVLLETVVDQLVCAIGAGPMKEGGPGSILSRAILQKIEVVYDQCARLAGPDGGNEIVTALRDDRNLWVVGAAVFRALGDGRLENILGKGAANSKYAKIGNMLPSGGRPPEGIAILNTSIAALTGTSEYDANTFSWAVATSQQISIMLARVYNTPGRLLLSLSARELLTKEIVTKRASTTKGMRLADLKDAIAIAVRKFVADPDGVGRGFSGHLEINLLPTRGLLAG